MAVIKAKKGKKGRAQIDKPLPPQKGKKAKQAEDSQNNQVPKSGNVEPLRRGTLRRNVSKKTFRTGEFVKNIRQFFSGAWQEMKKVHWPGRRVVVAYTGVVLAVVSVVMIIIWIADSIFSRILSLIIK